MRYMSLTFKNQKQNFADEMQLEIFALHKALGDERVKKEEDMVEAEVAVTSAEELAEAVVEERGMAARVLDDLRAKIKDERQARMRVEGQLEEVLTEVWLVLLNDGCRVKMFNGWMVKHIEGKTHMFAWYFAPAFVGSFVGLILCVDMCSCKCPPVIVGLELRKQ